MGFWHPGSIYAVHPLKKMKLNKRGDRKWSRTSISIQIGQKELSHYYTCVGQKIFADPSYRELTLLFWALCTHYLILPKKLSPQDVWGSSPATHINLMKSIEIHKAFEGTCQTGVHLSKGYASVRGKLYFMAAVKLKYHPNALRMVFPHIGGGHLVLPSSEK